MRLANERDQALLRSAVTDAIANLLDFVPSLGTREVVAFGEGLPLPTRMRFTELPPERLPQSEIFRLDECDSGAGAGFVRQVIERWRGAAGGGRLVEDGATPEPSHAAAPIAAAKPPGFGIDGGSALSRLEALRAQILKQGAGSS